MAEPKTEPATEPQPDPLPPEPTEPEDIPAPGAPDVEEPAPEPAPETRAVEMDMDVQVRSMARRELDVRLVPWGMVIQTGEGTEEFARGAFAETDPSKVLLMGLEHEVHFGLGQQGQPIFTRHPVGRGMSIAERDDGAHMTFRVAKTQRGDEILALAEEHIVDKVSMEFGELPGGTVVGRRNGRRHRVHQKVNLSGVATTYRPAYGEQAAVLAVRSQEPQTEITVTETQEAPVAGVELTSDRLAAAFEAIEARAAAQEAINEKFLERFDKFEEQARTDIQIPNPGPAKPPIDKGEWIKTVVRLMTGERLPDVQMRLLDDVITTDNAGVVPPAYLTELIGVIDTSRPFLATTRRLPTPESGMTLNVPVINQRPTAAVQTVEKTEVSSQKTLIGVEQFNAVTIAGAGDLSIQIIKRSSPSFLNLWIELLAEAYAIEAEDQALQALFNAIGGVGAGTALNPEDLNLGAAFVASFDAIRRPPDTIWMSTQAVGEFIDAKASTTNQPLYPGLAASATAAGGITGVVSGLRPVHVPALDAHGAYAIVGPSSGFAWAEDGTYTLQVDVPAKAGRDVALVGILWPAPWYPAAFTAYNVAS